MASAMAMAMERPSYCDALRRAAQVLGGPGKLARCLGVSHEQLERWLAGKEPAPLSVFLDTLDVIADGPYASEKRPVRVAVIASARETDH